MRAPNKQKVRACARRGKGAKCKHRVEGTKSAPKQHKVHATRGRKREQEDKTGHSDK